MNRRNYLALLGTASLATVAGCLGDDDDFSAEITDDDGIPERLDLIELEEGTYEVGIEEPSEEITELRVNVFGYSGPHEPGESFDDPEKAAEALENTDEMIGGVGGENIQEEIKNMFDVPTTSSYLVYAEILGGTGTYHIREE